MRGVQVGRVAAISGGSRPVSLQLEIYPDQIRYIPANVQAQIRATTAFGAKYVDLIYPERPSPQRLAAGAVLRVAQRQHRSQHGLPEPRRRAAPDRPAKLNAVLTAFAEVCADRVNASARPPPPPTMFCWRSTRAATRSGGTGARSRQFSDTYGAAAQDILATLDAASTTSHDHHQPQDAAGCVAAQHHWLRPCRHQTCSARATDNLIEAINTLEPTTDLLMKYNPEYTCLLRAPRRFYDQRLRVHRRQRPHGRPRCRNSLGQRPVSSIPDNLPVVAAKGGPGGKPGCGSLPDVSKNAGAPAGHQHRLGHRAGHPAQPRHRPPRGSVNYFPVTKGTPEPPRYFGRRPASTRPDSLPGRAAVRGAAVRARRSTAVAWRTARTRRDPDTWHHERQTRRRGVAARHLRRRLRARIVRAAGDLRAAAVPERGRLPRRVHQHHRAWRTATSSASPASKSARSSTSRSSATRPSWWRSAPTRR